MLSKNCSLHFDKFQLRLIEKFMLKLVSISKMFVFWRVISLIWGMGGGGGMVGVVSKYLIFPFWYTLPVGLIINSFLHENHGIYI